VYEIISLLTLNINQAFKSDKSPNSITLTTADNLSLTQISGRKHNLDLKLHFEAKSPEKTETLILDASVVSYSLNLDQFWD
jgi:hypothetical protein